MKAVGFDADGVLVDSCRAAWRAAEQVVGLFGAEPTISSFGDMEAAFGHSAQRALVGEQHAHALRMTHRLLMRHSAPVLDLFHEALAVAAGLPAPRVLISAALADGIACCLGAHATLFDEIVGFETGRKPDLLRAWAPRLGVYITDSTADVVDCQAANLPVIACAWGYEPLADLKAANPNAIAEHPAELPGLVNPFLQETMP